MANGGRASAQPPSTWTVRRVHDWHRELRRQRFERKVGGRPRYPVEVRELERALGQLRDLDRFLALLAGPARSAESAADRRWRRNLGARVARARDDRAARLSVPPGWVEEGPRRLPRVPEPPGPLGEPSPAYARRRALRKAVARALERPTPERTHEVRQEVRRWEAFLSFRASRRGRSPPRRTKVASRVMSTLGTLHDLDRSIDLLRRLPASQARARWLRELRRQRVLLAESSVRLLKKFGAPAIYAPE